MMKLFKYLAFGVILSLPYIMTAYAEQYVNIEVTDGVTQANVKVVGEQPADSVSNMYEKTMQTEKLIVTHCKQTQDVCACLRDYERKHALYSKQTSPVEQTIHDNNCQP
ncbi:MAG: RebB family R body protein [Coxiellaceae bacterium]|nr:RebB family R body protein [Coxiellaceae bacterium]